MISNDVEKGKESSLKEENIDESTFDVDSSCESVQSYNRDLDRNEIP